MGVEGTRRRESVDGGDKRDGGGEERETQKRKRRGVELREEEQIGVFHLLFNAFVAFLPCSAGECVVFHF